jgi:hypothetical protein
MQDVIFTNWIRWSERTSMEGIHNPGVYLLVHFDSAPSGKAKPLAKKIIYIGETCNNSLKGRWNQFNRSAFQGKDGHSGGITYRQVFGDKGSKLYIAALPVDKMDGMLRSLFIRYIERKLIWEFAQKWGTAPKCNKK